LAVTLTITEDAPYLESRRSPRGSQIIQIAGSATGAGDTGTFSPSFVAPDQILGGAFKISYVASTGVATVTSIYALGTNTVAVEIIGSPK
jgi:hypothetical protein